MERKLTPIREEIYKKCMLEVSELIVEPESKGYAAIQFKLNGRHIISRNSKFTPKKVGQFVTFWKRNKNGLIEPFCQNDPFDFFVVNTKFNSKLGQFVFPKSILTDKEIISTDKKEGKRGFRVYPNWDAVISKQAEKTQKWQLDFFYEANAATDLTRVFKLYQQV